MNDIHKQLSKSRLYKLNKEGRIKILPKNMKKAYSYKKTGKKVLKFALIIVIPWLINSFTMDYPEVANLTVSGALVLGLDFLKHKLGFAIKFI